MAVIVWLGRVLHEAMLGLYRSPTQREILPTIGSPRSTDNHLATANRMYRKRQTAEATTAGYVGDSDASLNKRRCVCWCDGARNMRQRMPYSVSRVGVFPYSRGTKLQHTRQALAMPS